ncbi:porin family protein [Celeribacter halophilus]|uniref:Porin family protein n=1 Tax=Celeribacter halophilus TaxID=576117 RepID=A0AAW7XWN1_9RHOB|nr:porin family protein [Celeribacter halophilus]MDO6458472.1 porin family protein [Celeribacter halophilus]
MGRSFSLRLICALILVLINLGLGAQAESAITAREAYAKLMQLGQVALAKDAPEKAIVYFSKARRIAPRDPRAQLSLAEAFARGGQVRRGEAFLRYLLRQPDQAQNEVYYLAALAKLQSRYPFVASASFAALPSTNIRNTSSQTVFDTLLGRFEIDDGGDETSGIGVDVGVKGLYRQSLADGFSFEFGTSLHRIWYGEPELRYWRGRLTADLIWLEATQDLRVGLHADRIYYTDVEEDSSDRIASGIHGHWSRALPQDTRLSLNGLAEYRDYLDKGSLSGPYASLGLGWSKRFDNSALFFLGGSIERSKPSLDYHRYWGTTMRAGYDTNITDTLRGGINLSATLRHYDSDFSAVDYARQDEVYRIGVSLSDKRIKIMGGTPKLSCSYKIQNSNIALYEATSTDCRIGWSYQF